MADAPDSTLPEVTSILATDLLAVTTDPGGTPTTNRITVANFKTSILAAYLPLAGGTMTGNLLFTDNSFDIGASGATRPRDLFLSRNLTVGSLTSGRVAIVGTAGLLGDSTGFLFNSTSKSGSVGPNAAINSIGLLYPLEDSATNTFSVLEEHTSFGVTFPEGLTNYHLLNPSGAVTAFYGLDSQIVTKSSNAQNFTTLYNGFFQARHEGSGTVGYMATIFAQNSAVGGAVSEMIGIAGEIDHFKNGVTIPVASSFVAYGYNDGTGTITSLNGLRTDVTNFSTGTIDAAHGVHITSAVNSGGGAITTFYGLKVENQTAAGTNYAIHTGSGLVQLGTLSASRLVLTDASKNLVSASFTLASPGTSGNVLTSDGTNWTSVAPAGGSITVGTTAIASGTGGRLVYETSGNKFGEIGGATSDGNVITFAPSARSSGAAAYFSITAPADTGQTLNTNFPGIVLGGDGSLGTVIRTGADGTTYALQTEVYIPNPTYAFAGATTVTDAATLYIKGSPILGTNATITRRSALIIDNAANDIWASLMYAGSEYVRIGQIGTSGGYGISSGAVGTTGNGFGFVSSVPTISNSGAITTWQAINGSGTAFLTGSTGSNTTPVIEIPSVGLTTKPGLKIGSTAAQSADAIQVFDSGPTKNFAVLPTGATTVGVRDAGTNTITSGLTAFHRSTGTPAAGLGSAILFNLDSSTTADQAAAQFKSAWGVATHASRAAWAGIATNLVGSTTLLDRFITGGHTVVVTDNAALSLFEVALATLQGCAGRINYSVFCGDGTEVQVRRGIAIYSAVNKGGSYTSEAAIVSEAASVSAGTLTATFAVTSGTNKVTIQITPDTSLTTPTTYYVKWELANLSESAITVL